MKVEVAVPNSPYGLTELAQCQSSGAVCVKVEVAVLGFPSPIVLTISVAVKPHWT